MKRRQLVAACAAAAAVGWTPWAFAQAYPERPIKIYQGFAPGGNADAIARAVGLEMGKTLGQPIVVEAQSGAGGTIAAATVARARPDGYTLLLATGGHAVAGALYNTLPYKSVADFEMISTLTYFPFLIVVNANSKVQGLAEVLAAARAAPGTVAYGTAGVGSTHHLAGELLAKMAGAPMLHVPYRGDAAALTALLGGDIPFIVAPPTAVMSNILAGKLRAIATTGPQRWPGLPNVPTVAESGVPGYEVVSWQAIFAPAGTPKAIVDRLHTEIAKILATPDMQDRLAKLGMQGADMSPEQLGAFQRAEVAKWATVIKEANIKLE